MNTESTTQAGTISPDGHYVYTGFEWVLREPVAPVKKSHTKLWIGVGVAAAVGAGALVMSPGFQQGFQAGYDASASSSAAESSGSGEVAAAPSVQDVESEFVSVVRSHAGPMNVGDADLLYHGRSACERLSAGVEFPMVVNTKAMFLGEYDAATTVSAAVGWFCPEHRDQALYYLGG